MDRKISAPTKLGITTLVLATMFAVSGLGITGALAAPITTGLSPTLYGTAGDTAADLNGDGLVTTTDDSAALYGDTAIIDGKLDCNAWTSDNDGAAGSGTITIADDCTLVAFDGASDHDGLQIRVVDGAFATMRDDNTTPGAFVPIPDGTALPTVFNAAQPDNPSVFSSDFAWSTIDGRVDSNGNAEIDGEDCTFNVVGTVDVLGSDVGCGFAVTPDASMNGKVDLNSDETITNADTCFDGCFFGRNVVRGVVDGGLVCTEVGTAGPDILVGTDGRDVICGLGGNDTMRGLDGRDTLKGGRGNDLMRGQIGNDKLVGGNGTDKANGGLGRDQCLSSETEVSCER